MGGAAYAMDSGGGCGEVEWGKKEKERRQRECELSEREGRSGMPGNSKMWVQWYSAI
jgi:hypothetical protein